MNLHSTIWNFAVFSVCCTIVPAQAVEGAVILTSKPAVDCRNSSDSQLSAGDSVEVLRKYKEKGASTIDYGKVAVGLQLPQYFAICNSGRRLALVEIAIEGEAGSRGWTRSERQRKQGGRNEEEMRLHLCPISFLHESEKTNAISSASDCASTLNSAKMQNYDRSGFYICGNSLFVAPGQTVTTFGPVYFLPTRPGSYHASLIARVNETLEHSLELTGFGLKPQLFFLNASGVPHRSSEVPFRISHSDLETQLTAGGKFRERLRFRKKYTVRNLGSGLITVRGIVWEGLLCAAMGFTIENCETETELLPGESLSVFITYESAMLQREARIPLSVLSDFPPLSFLLCLSVDLSDVSLIRASQGVSASSWSYFLSEISLLGLSSCAIALLLTSGLDLVCETKRCHVSRKRRESQWQSVRRVVNAPKFETASKCAENTQEKPLAKEEKSQGRQRKIKHQKPPALKFAPGSAVARPAPRPLVATFAPRRDAACESDCEKRVERSSTAASQTEDDCEFLDEYKNRLGLFRGFAIGS